MPPIPLREGIFQLAHLLSRARRHRRSKPGAAAQFFSGSHAVSVNSACPDHRVQRELTETETQLPANAVAGKQRKVQNIHGGLRR